MATHATTDFLTGVIEGFYGQPWLQAERFELFDWMAAWGLNTYLYGPKDDLKHRAIWRELYSASEAGTLGEVIRGCQQQGARAGSSAVEGAVFALFGLLIALPLPVLRHATRHGGT